jgi:uncharacterized protein YPO0396
VADNVNVEEEVRELKAQVNNHETRLVVAERDIENINRKLDKIDANTSKLLWIVVAAVVGALLKIVISGGF